MADQRTAREVVDIVGRSGLAFLQPGAAIGLDHSAVGRRA